MAGRYSVGLQILTALILKSTVLWVATPCVSKGIIRFGGTYQLHFLTWNNLLNWRWRRFGELYDIKVSFWPPLWSSGQSSWLQIQRSGFDSRRYHIFWEVVGLERVPLSLVSTIEELLERKSSGSGLENREYGCRDPSRWPSSTLYPQTLLLTSPTSGVRSVGIVRSRTQATEYFIDSFCWFLLQVNFLHWTWR
jgi:hypothetical protein